MAASCAADNQVDERIALIRDKLQEDEYLRTQALPGLHSLLDDYLAPGVDVVNTSFMRRLLLVFKDSPLDQTYQELLAKHTSDEQDCIECFLQGAEADEVAGGFQTLPSLGLREEIERLATAPKAIISAIGTDIQGLGDEQQTEEHGFRKFVHGLAKAFQDLFQETDGKAHVEQHGITVYEDVTFQNWGRTVKNVPRYTVVPTSVAAVQRTVRYAAAHNLGVRCSGYRHSWSPLFGRAGHILMSMLSLHTATTLPNTTSLPLPESAANELETIELVGSPASDGKQLVRVGCSVTNERLRRFCIKNGKVTLPMNVIMVEMTLGGSNAPICHGAGKSNRTLSDIVRKIEYVDAHGELRSVTDTAQLKAASGCFGLMGVVTHLTLELDRMSYAELRPAKLPVIQAIPPPLAYNDDGSCSWTIRAEDIPPALRPTKPLTDDERKSAQAAFEERANNYYYSEWFWFPYSDFAWINCWQKTDDSSDVKPYPSSAQVFLSFVETFTLNVLQYAPVLEKLVEATGMSEAAVTLLSRFAMLNLPEVHDSSPPIKAALPDALHFQRAIQNVRVRDLEIEMPLQPSKSDRNKVDYTLVQQAWWDAIMKCYQHSDKCPQRMPLEMRIMGDSDIIMAPQRGNSLGTCSIEVLTLQNAVDFWKPYAQEVLDRWMSYTDADGKPLKTRPHWAKEWYSYTVQNPVTLERQPWFDKLKNEDYPYAITEFKTVLAAIGEEHGWTLDDLKARFSNDLFDSLVFA